MITVKLNPKDVEGIKSMLSKLTRDEADAALVRGINTTMTGVRTDGTKILYDHYALTATAIRASWNISKARFRDPSGVISCQGTFIRLKEFGAIANKAGVSVKVLRENPRKTIKHAFFAKLKQNDQVYWRKYNGPRSKMVANKGYYANLPFQYRFPVEALYGPRIQDYLGDPQIIGTLENMAGERISKNMEREIDAILRGF